MSLDNTDVVDAIGIECGSGNVVLTILDGWDWCDVCEHILALQEKLTAYLNFIEGGQLESAYPASIGRHVVIDVVTQYAMPARGIEFIQLAAAICGTIGLELRTRHVVGSAGDDASSPSPRG